MGYNTVVMVLNDRLSDIEKDPDFGRKLVHQIMHTHARHDEYVPGPHGTSVLPSVHADTSQLVVVQANSLRLLGYGWSSDPEQCMRLLADELGFSVTKKPALKAPKPRKTPPTPT
jgi:hypothetical protein